MTIHIPSTSERVEMRLSQDAESGLLYLEASPYGVATYSLRGMLNLGWRIVDSTPDERALLDAQGFEIAG